MSAALRSHQALAPLGGESMTVHERSCFSDAFWVRAIRRVYGKSLPISAAAAIDKSRFLGSPSLCEK
jgi:hypothetical protein